MKDLIKKGVGYSFLGQAYQLLAQFTLGIWLARLLGPNAYGLVAMVTVFSGIAGMLMDFGLNTSLIQKKDVNLLDYSTVFWFNLSLAIIFYVVFFLSAPAIANFYDRQELVLITRLVSLQFLINAFGVTQRAKITKRIDFKTLSLVDILVSLLSFAVAIYLAYSGYGALTIVIQLLVKSFLSVLIINLLVKQNPKFVFSKRIFQEHFNFGMKVTADSLLNYFSRNIDNLLIGKYLGGDSLGIYSKAYSVILFPIKNLSLVVKKVLFPAFSMMQASKEDVKNYYLKVTRYVAFITFPLMAFLTIESKNIVFLLYGEEWAGLVPLIKYFGLLGMVQSILTFNGTIYLSQGRPGLAVKVGFLTKSISVSCISLGLYLNGLEGVAQGLVVAQLLNLYPVLSTAGKLINLSLFQFFKNMWKIVVAVVFSMIVGGTLVSFELPSGVYELVIIGAVLFIVFFAFSFILKEEAAGYYKNQLFLLINKIKS